MREKREREKDNYLSFIEIFFFLSLLLYRPLSPNSFLLPLLPPHSPSFSSTPGLPSSLFVHSFPFFSLLLYPGLLLPSFIRRFFSFSSSFSQSFSLSLFSPFFSFSLVIFLSFLLLQFHFIAVYLLSTFLTPVIIHLFLSFSFSQDKTQGNIKKNKTKHKKKDFIFSQTREKRSEKGRKNSEGKIKRTESDLLRKSVSGRRRRAILDPLEEEGPRR